MDRISPFGESGTFDEATELLSDGVELSLVHVHDEDNELISPPPPDDFRRMEDGREYPILVIGDMKGDQISSKKIGFRKGGRNGGE